MFFELTSRYYLSEDSDNRRGCSRAGHNKAVVLAGVLGPEAYSRGSRQQHKVAAKREIYAPNENSKQNLKVCSNM